jgi:hypothetical protein
MCGSATGRGGRERGEEGGGEKEGGGRKHVEGIGEDISSRGRGTFPVAMDGSTWVPHDNVPHYFHKFSRLGFGKKGVALLLVLAYL